MAYYSQQAAYLGNSEAQLELGKYYENNKHVNNYQQALHWYKQIGKGKPRYPDARLYMGSCCRSLKRYAEAILYYEQAVKLYEHSSEMNSFKKVKMFAELAFCYKMENNFTKAFSIYLKALEPYEKITIRSDFENATINLTTFGDELGLSDLKFDDDKTCILGINEKFSMHLTFEPNKSKIIPLFSDIRVVCRRNSCSIKTFRVFAGRFSVRGEDAGWRSRDSFKRRTDFITFDFRYESI